MNTREDERQLWCAVIGQAVDDATTPLGPNRRRNMVIINARDWLMKPNRDFADVCRLAGYEPDRVRAQAIRLIGEVTPRDCPPPPKPRKPRAPRIRKTDTAINEGNEANVTR
jgi:hypothetical protein